MAKAETALKAAREEIALLKATRSNTPSESDGSVYTDRASAGRSTRVPRVRSRGESKEASRDGDKTDRRQTFWKVLASVFVGGKCTGGLSFENFCGSQRRRARRDMEAAMLEAERLKGELAAFKLSYEQVWKEFMYVCM